MEAAKDHRRRYGQTDETDDSCIRTSIFHIYDDAARITSSWLSGDAILQGQGWRGKGDLHSGALITSLHRSRTRIEGIILHGLTY